MARQAHAAHKVYLDNCVPIIIGDLLERLRLVYAHVIDKNIHDRHSLDTFGNSVRRGEIYSDAADFRVADFFPDTFSRAINSLLSAASDNDRRSFPRQRTGNREADSGGRSCDQRFRSIIRVSGEKDDRQMGVAADGDCGNDAIDGSSKSDVHKNQIWLM